jgi:hypothetical protein
VDSVSDPWCIADNGRNCSHDDCAAPCEQRICDLRFLGDPMAARQALLHNGFGCIGITDTPG